MRCEWIIMRPIAVGTISSHHSRPKLLEEERLTPLIPPFFGLNSCVKGN